MNKLYFQLFAALVLIFSPVTTLSQVSEIDAGTFFKEIKEIKNDATQRTYEATMRFDANQAFKSFTGTKRALLTNFPIAPNVSAEVELRKNRPIIDANTKFLISGKEAKNASPPRLLMFSGAVKGELGSKVDFIISGDDVFCRIMRDNGESYLIIPVESKSANCALISEDSYYRGGNFGFSCYSDFQEDVELKFDKVNAKLLSDEALEVEIAIETDTEFFNACGSDVDKARDYALAIFAMVSRIYQESMGISFYVTWINNWTDSPSDPYDCAGDPFALRDAARVYWQTNNKGVERDIFHVMTSVSYGGGGFGYFNALCRGNGFDLSVSSVQCQHNYPTYAFTYDVYIVAHEMGHNFNGQHTHGCHWGYPLDTCVVEDAIEGGCLKPGTEPKPNPGSIMSYCGGTNSQFGLGYQVEMKFRPENISIMRTAAEGAQCVTTPEEPKVFLFSPNRHRIYEPNQEITVKWKSERVTSVDLEISDSGELTTIAEGISAALEEYSFNLPDKTGNNFKIIISSSDDSEVSDTSVIGFAIDDREDSLLAYYDFPGNAENRVASEYPDARAVGEITYAKDRFDRDNQAASFDGESFLFVPNANCVFEEFSVSLWINPNKLSSKSFMIGTDFGPALNVFSIYYWGVLGWSLYFQSGLQQFWGPNINKNEWTHAVFVFDGESSEIYINGDSYRKAEVEESLIPLKTAVYIGARNGKEGFSGLLDDIMIFNKAISAEKVTELYNEAEGPRLLTPENDAQDVILPIEFTWSGKLGADEYEIQIAESEQFLEPYSVTVEKNSYSFYDTLKSEAEYFWRVRAVYGDADGSWSSVFSFATGEIIGVEDHEEPSFALYPNPARNRLYVLSPFTIGEVSVRVYTLEGKKLIDKKVRSNSGAINLSLNEIPSGVYIIELKKGFESRSRKFIRE